MRKWRSVRCRGKASATGLREFWHLQKFRINDDSEIENLNRLEISDDLTSCEGDESTDDPGVDIF